MKQFIHKQVVRLWVKPFVWAYNQKKQTWFTKAIRAFWHWL